MEGLKPPRQLSMEGDIAENWKRWKQQFYLYLVASGGTKQTEEIKVATLLHVIGTEALEKYNTFDITKNESNDLDSIIEAFEQYCVPKSNETVNRYLFFTRIQRDGETFDAFLTDIKKLSTDCAFESLRDSLIRDRIICGIRNKSLKDRLLRETQLDLDKYTKMCKTTELANQQLGMDIFYYKGKDFLLVVDMYSKFVEVEKLRDMLALTTIKALKRMISSYGIPRLIYSDNGPQFNNKHFREFTNNLGIEHRTSSPKYAQSNGLAERYIQTVKQMWKKADIENKDLYLVMLEYNATPIAEDMESPSQLMFNRRVQGILPVRDQFVNKEPNDEHRWKLKQRQLNQGYYYNRGTKDLEQLKVHDNVFTTTNQNKHTLMEAEVISQNQRPRSYNLLTKEGAVIGRNRRDIYRNSSKHPMEIQKEIPEEDSEAMKPIGSQNIEDTPAVKTVTPEHMPTIQTAIGVTRSGRITRQPLYLKDYVT